MSGKTVVVFTWRGSDTDVTPKLFGVFRTPQAIESNRNARTASAAQTLVAEGTVHPIGIFPIGGALLVPYTAHECFTVRVFASKVAPDALQSPPGNLVCADNPATTTTAYAPNNNPTGTFACMNTPSGGAIYHTGSPETDVETGDWVGMAAYSPSTCPSGTGSTLHSQVFQFPAIAVKNGVVSATLSVPGDLRCAQRVSSIQSNPGHIPGAPKDGTVLSTWDLGGASSLSVSVLEYAALFNSAYVQNLSLTYRIDPAVTPRTCLGAVKGVTLTVVTLN